MPDETNDSPEAIIFDSNLQEFAQQIGIICALESNEKISAHEAYKRIKHLWKQLKKSKRGLGIGQPSQDHHDNPSPPGE